MAAKLSGGGGGKYSVGQNHDMNVTPFVDVMLVLLIIFMVAAPLATVAIKVDIPPAPPPTEVKEKKDPVFVSIQQGGKVFIVDEPTDLVHLTAALNAKMMSADPKNETILIRADREVLYEDFMHVVNTLQENGFYKVGLISEDL